MGALTRALSLAIAGGLAGCTMQSAPQVVGRPSEVAPVRPAAVQPTAPEQSVSPAEQGYGWLNLSVRWPEQVGYNVALLPTTTNSLVIWIKKGGTTLGTPIIVSRQAGATQATQRIRVAAALNLSVEVKAYRETEPDLATAEPIAQDSGIVNVVRSKVTTLPLTLKPLNEPSVTAIDHNLGKAGETLTVTGTHFGSGTVPVTVTFNGMPASKVQRLSETTLTVAVPASATTGYLVVTADGVSATSKVPFWVAGDFQLMQPIKESWDQTLDTSRQVLYGQKVQFSERHNWVLKDGETAGQYGTPPEVTWSLSDPAVGTIDQTGFFTAAKTHVSGVVSAHIGDWDSPTISVQMVGVDAVSLDKTDLTLNAAPPDGLPDPGFVTSAQLTARVDTTAPFNRGVVWESSDTTRVRVSNGLVTTVPNAAEGKVTITATSFDDPTKKATASVTVTRLGDLELGIE